MIKKKNSPYRNVVRMSNVGAIVFATFVTVLTAEAVAGLNENRPSGREASSDDIAASSSPTKVIILVDGSRMAIKSYVVKERVVLLTTSDGKLRSVLRSYVNLEATERENGVSVATAPPQPPDPAPATAPPQPDPAPVQPDSLGSAEPPASESLTPSYVNLSSSPSGARRQVVAFEAKQSVIIDGALDDEVWTLARPASDFVQSEPLEGQPATEVTEVRVAYDAQNLYIAAYCHDRDPAGIIINNIREDFRTGSQDSFEIILDTFADRRNGFVFITNPAGARSDEQMANEGREVNVSWDAVWHVGTSLVHDGWIAEMAIPFNQLRFDMSRSPVWGINFARRIRRKNEVNFWSPVPRAYTLNRVSLAGDLVGLPFAHAGHHLQVKPYGLADTVRPTGGDSFDNGLEVGLDVKYGVTPAATLDLAVNPDFAQVEVDQQRVNLTQFSLFFPEQREFFLENSGIFYIGDAAVASRTSRGGLAPGADTDLLPFFSRRIGLTDDGFPISILAGARLTGNLAGLSMGLLNAQVDRTEESPANNYSVIRLRRNISASSDIGGIFMNKQSTDNSEDYNRVYGLDATIRFLGNTDWSTYALKSATPGLTGGDYAFRSTINRDGNFFHIKTGMMSIGENFHNEMGFLRRTDVNKYILDTGIRPRSESLRRRGIREMHPHVIWNYFTDLSGQLVAKQFHTAFSIFFNNGGFVEVSQNPKFQLITSPFTIHQGSPPIPPGGYPWNEYQVWGITDRSRVVSVDLRYIFGGLWSGTQRSLRSIVTVKPSYKLSVSLGVERTDASLDLPPIDFVKSIWTMRANYSFATNMFLDSLLQYDQDRGEFNANIRFNFMHHPLSDLYIVYNEQRFRTLEDFIGPGRIPPGRSIIVKFTQMLAF